MEAILGRAGPPASTLIAPPATVTHTPIPYLDVRSAMSLNPVWRAVSIIADTVADMPWQEWRGEYERIQPPSRLIRRPYTFMTRREWTWRVVATEALFNVAHCLHVGGKDSAGSPWALLPIPPALIQPTTLDPYGLLPPSEYLVAGERVSADFVTVIRRAPLPGLSDQTSGLLDLARRQFTAYLAADTHMTRYWVNGGPVLTQITLADELAEGEGDQIAQEWADHRAMGSEFPVVFGKGGHAEGWGADPLSESAVEARKEMAAEIGRYFGLPTRLLNAPASDSQTYANVENDAIDLYRYTFRGYMSPVEDAISELIPGDYIEGRRMVMDPSRFLQGDLESRSRAWVPLVQTGIVDQDEARTRGFGLPPRGASVPPQAAITAAVATGGDQTPAAESAVVTVE